MNHERLIDLTEPIDEPRLDKFLKRDCEKISRAQQKGRDIVANRLISELTTYAQNVPNTIPALFQLVGTSRWNDGAVAVLARYGTAAFDHVGKLDAICDRNPPALFATLTSICQNNMGKLAAITRCLLESQPRHWETAGLALSTAIKNFGASASELHNWLWDDDAGLCAAAVLALGLVCDDDLELEEIIERAVDSPNKCVLCAAVLLIMKRQPVFNTIGILLESIFPACDYQARKIIASEAARNRRWREELFPFLEQCLKSSDCSLVYRSAALLAELAVHDKQLPSTTPFVYLLLQAKERRRQFPAERQEIREIINYALCAMDPNTFRPLSGRIRRTSQSQVADAS